MSLIIPSNNIIKPATLSRRGFLRAMGVTAAVIAVPSLVVPDPRFTSGEIIMTIWFYDVRFEIDGIMYNYERMAIDELDSLYPSIIRSHGNRYQLRDGREHPDVAETDPARGTFL